MYLDILVWVEDKLRKRVYYGEKIPMGWGRPQQTEWHQKSIHFNMQEKQMLLTLRDIEHTLFWMVVVDPRW